MNKGGRASSAGETPDQGTKVSREGAAPSRSKTSVVSECRADERGLAFGVGFERGPEAGRPGVSAPERAAGPIEGLGPAAEALGERAVRLRASAEEVLDIAPKELAVTLVSADVAERAPSGTRQRTIETARLDIGRGRPFSPWSRMALLEPGAAAWPEGWLDAAARVVLGQRSSAGPAPNLADRAFVLDAFAVADLVRLRAHLWLLEPPRPGAVVAAAEVSLADPGVLGLAEGGTDALGDPIRPFEIVRGGCWVGGPRARDTRPGAAGPTGSMLATSWRCEPRLALRSLHIDVPRGPWPPVPAVVTGVVALGQRIFGSGYVEGRGGAVEGFCAEALPDALEWFRRARASLGPCLPDGGGVPALVSALRIDPVPGGGCASAR